MEQNSDDLPATLDGRFFHIATAIQSGNVFHTPEDIQIFIREQHGNLANLPTEKRKRLVWPRAALLDKDDSSLIPLKSRRHSIFPLKAGEWLGANFEPIESVKSQLSTSRLEPAAFPIYLGNGIFCTIHDIDESGIFAPKQKPVSLGGFLFSKQAILCSAFWSILIEVRTLPLLEFGHRFKAPVSLDDSDCVMFSKEVCTWGGRGGIFSEFSKHHNGSEINAWLTDCAHEMSAERAVERGAAFKGLDISFASKHLRFVDPNRFATFDSLLAQAFQLDLTPRNYSIFLQQLQKIQREFLFDDDLATIEHGLFTLLQPLYEANRLKDGVKMQATDSPLFFSCSSDSLIRDFVPISNFSDEITLFQRKSQSHIYGFSKQQDTRGRHQLALLCMFNLSAQDVITPEFFGVHHDGLRTEPAYRHLRWQLSQEKRGNLAAWESI